MRKQSLSTVCLFLLATCATTGATVIACSSADEGVSRGSGGKSGGNGKGSGGSGGGDNTTGTGGVGGSTGGVGGSGGAGGNGGIIDPGKGAMDAGPMTCGGDKYHAEQRPLDMYVMF